jgi:acetoin utilization deacetylase AcuC-like enzyme
LKVVFHERYCEPYGWDPAAAPERIESILREIEGDFEFVTPRPATLRELRLAHTRAHIESVRHLSPRIFEAARLAVGGAIKASEIAIRGEPAFALVRPPGHHAGRKSCWDFCFFNNIAVAVEGLRRSGSVGRVLIVDIDYHYGDGTADIFAEAPDVVYHHVAANTRREFLKKLARCLEASKYDLLAVSAGFDAHREDWGSPLETEDYEEIGRLISIFAGERCGGRRFAVLEGGYNTRVLGKCVKSFLHGFAGP